MAKRSVALARPRRRFYRRFMSRGRSSPKMTIPLAVIAGMVPLAAGTITRGIHMGWGTAGDTATDFLVRSITGYSPSSNNWRLSNLKTGLVPILAGFATHYVASAIGVNRLLARARVPFLRI